MSRLDWSDLTGVGRAPRPKEYRLVGETEYGPIYDEVVPPSPHLMLKARQELVAIKERIQREMGQRKSSFWEMMPSGLSERDYNAFIEALNAQIPPPFKVRREDTVGDPHCGYTVSW